MRWAGELLVVLFWVYSSALVSGAEVGPITSPLTLMSRASDSLSHLLQHSRQQNSNPPIQVPSQAQQAQHQPQQVQDLSQQSSTNSTPAPPLVPLHLQRLNSLVLSGANQLAQANLSAGLGGAAKYGTNMLEVLSNVGKAIQQQIQGPSPTYSTPAPQLIAAVQTGEQQQSINLNSNSNLNTTQAQQQQQQQQHYREQGELLRQEILRRAGQLQQVVASSMEMMKSNGDLIVRRLLEQLSHRLDQAKSKADRIVLESPATNEVAIRALTTINQGLNNVNNIVTNIVSRLEASAREAQSNAQVGSLASSAAGSSAQQRAGGSSSAPISPPALLLDPARLRSSLEQLKQQFSAAVQAAQQQRQANRLN